jgi:histone deacetylase 6
MEEDEDTVMGELSQKAVLPVMSGPVINSESAREPIPEHLGQRSALIEVAPSIHGSLLTLRSPSSTHDSTPGLDAPVSIVKDLENSIEEEGLNNKSSEDTDSLMEENSDWSVEDALAPKGVSVASLPSGLCYDVRMRYHCEVRPTADVHPEDPRRIYYIYKELCRAGLVDDPESSRPLAPVPLQRIDVRDATEEEIQLVHTSEHYRFVESTKGKPSQQNRSNAKKI